MTRREPCERRCTAWRARESTWRWGSSDPRDRALSGPRSASRSPNSTISPVMAALFTTTAPSLTARGARPALPSAYFAITIDAAVDLLEAREYQGLPRAERLAKALGEQQGFLNGFFDPALKAALDLRIVV